MKKILFWNVDTQVDFVEETGRLAVPKAVEIRPVLRRLTDFAKEKGIQVVNTADWHNESTKEISETPDFVNTFPKHCMEYTRGASYISETYPRTPFVVLDWSEAYDDDMIRQISSVQNIVVRKDMFDVFSGNPYTRKLVSYIAPSVVYVYGLATNVCVDFAVMGLLARQIKVFVIEDGIKELPNIDSPVSKWVESGAILVESESVFETLA